MLSLSAQRLLLQPPAWVLRGSSGPSATIDHWYERGLLYQQGIGATPGYGTGAMAQRYITVSRASAGYIDNLNGLWTSVAAGLPRLSDKGLLVEEARTNSIRNNSAQGASAPSTSPNNWAIDGLAAAFNGITTTVVSTGVENGIDYVDLRFQGTPTSTVSMFARFEASTQIAASNGQTWAWSAFLKIQSGSMTNIANLFAFVGERNGAGANLANTQTTFTPTTAALGTQRYTTSRTNNNASTAFELPAFGFPITNGQAIDITLRVGLPQLELGAFATSPIRTTSAAATRAADVVTVTRPPVFRSRGAMFADATFASIVNSAVSNQFLLRYSASNFNDMMALNIADTSVVDQASASGGAFDGAALTSGAISAGVAFKAAGAWAENDLSAIRNAGSVGQDTSFTMPLNLSVLNIGSDHNGTNHIGSAYLRRVALWANQRVPNADLLRLTA